MRGLARRERYAADRDAAQSLISEGATTPRPDLDASELAAYTVMAGVVLNPDELVTKE